MLRTIAAATLGCLLIVGAGSGSAGAQQKAVFDIVNATPWTVYVRLYSGKTVWPSGGLAFKIDQHGSNRIQISCQAGEQICYGASYAPNADNHYWGVGVLGGKGCDGCCQQCGQTNSWNLTDASTPATTPPQRKLVAKSRTSSFGGQGGGAYELACPFGSVMIGLNARYGAWIDALSPICATYVRLNGPGTSLAEVGPQPFTGGNGGGPGYIRCAPPRGAVVELELFQA